MTRLLRMRGAREKPLVRGMSRGWRSGSPVGCSAARSAALPRCREATDRRGFRVLKMGDNVQLLRVRLAGFLFRVDGGPQRKTTSSLTRLVDLLFSSLTYSSRIEDAARDGQARLVTHHFYHSY